jgi:hypothetical protein
MGTGLWWALQDVPVCIPKAAPTARMTRKMAKGTRLGCNPLLRLSVTENTTKTRTNVPTNWRGEMRYEISFDAEVRFGQDGGGLSLHQKNNWLTTCNRANPKEFTTVRCGQREGKTRTDRVGGEKTSTFQRTLTVPALKDVDGFRVIGENDECSQPCAEELTEDVGDRLEPWKPSEDSHAERHLEIRAHLSESLHTV